VLARQGSGIPGRAGQGMINLTLRDSSGRASVLPISFLVTTSHDNSYRLPDYVSLRRELDELVYLSGSCLLPCTLLVLLIVCSTTALLS
jgi:uncharacterized protein YpmS